VALRVTGGLVIAAVFGVFLGRLVVPGSSGNGAADPAGPLHAPETTPAQDNEYLLDVTKADPDLATYVQEQGDTALRALVTDGSAFCAFLAHGGGMDNALASVAIGARSVESQTSLPLAVATFNTMESVALVVLCPNEQRLVPASVQSELGALKTELAHGP